MEHQQSDKRRTCCICVEPYLAVYARRKFEVDQKTGGIKIPDNFDLYHCVWQLMSKWPLERWHIGVKRRVEVPQGNLLIHLPNRRPEGGFGKNPRYWNYISPRSARVINRELKRLFDWEFHHYVENALIYGRGISKKEAVRRFSAKYGLGIDTEDALLKNFQRYERKNRLFLSLNKRKNATTSTTVLSSSVPPLLKHTDRTGDDNSLCGSWNPLATLIRNGLEQLAQPDEVADCAS